VVCRQGQFFFSLKKCRVLSLVKMPAITLQHVCCVLASTISSYQLEREQGQWPIYSRMKLWLILLSANQNCTYIFLQHLGLVCTFTMHTAILDLVLSGYEALSMMAGLFRLPGCISWDIFSMMGCAGLRASRHVLRSALDNMGRWKVRLECGQTRRQHC
jgi:hypothetical protein